ncbi:hypothetical protein J6A64_02015 [bacterium]|nr:hypothetical protein [bacterium]
MALDVSKLRQQEQVQATGNNPAASTSASSSSQPIDMKTGTMTAEEKQAKVLEFIKSGEFKKCPDDQKLELLKQQFPELAELSEENLVKYFTEALNTLSTEEQAKIVETLAHTFKSETLVAEHCTELASLETPEVETEPKATEAQDTNTSELEQLAEKYCTNNDIENADINDIIAKIATKEQLDETSLTEDERKILEIYRKNTEPEDNASIKLMDTQKYYQTKDGKTTISDEYYLLSSTEQVQVTLQKYLEDSDKEFAQLPDSEKQKVLNENFIELTQIIGKDESWSKIGSNEVASQVAFSLIMVAKHNNISLQELNNKDINEIKALIDKGQTAIKEQFKELTGAVLTPQAMNILQNQNFIKRALIKSDPSFTKLTKDEQQKIIDKKLQEYFDIELEKIKAAHPHLSDEKLEALAIRELNGTLTVALENCKDGNIIEYINSSYKDENKVKNIEGRIEILNSEIAALPKNSPLRSEKERELKHKEFAYWIYDQNPDFDNLTPDEKQKYFSEIANDETIPEHIRRQAAHHVQSHNQAHDYDENSNYDSFQITNNVYEFRETYNISGETTAEDITDITKNIKSKHQRGEFYGQLMLASTTVDDPVKFMNEVEAAMLKDGFTPEEIKKFKLGKEHILHQVANIRNGEDACNFRHIHGDCHETSKVAQYVAKWLTDPNEQAIAAKGYLDKYSKEIATGMNLYNSIDQTTEVFDLLGKDKDVNAGDLSIFAENIIETSTSDNNRLALADRLSDMGNPAILEGIAAGADSIQNQSYRNQYNSIVNQAAQNYPPEVQQTIRTALTTGQVSQETRNNTESASNTYYSGTNNSGVTNKNTYNTHQQAPTYTSSNNQNNLGVTKTTLENNVNPTVQKSNTDAAKIKEQAINNEAQANQKMKDIALENVAEVKQKIDESIAEWELKQELKLSDEVISELKEIAASEALEEYIQANPTKKEQIIQKLSNATSLSEVYDILLSNLGSKVHQKFIDNLARSGSTSEVRAFIKSKAGNTAVIKEILLRTSNQTLRSELINMLPASDVIELLEKNLITALNSIDHKIIYEYLAKNIYSMTQTNFANYLKYLPLDEREKLIALRNKAYGVNPTQTQQAEVQVQTTQGAQQNGQNVAQTQPAQPKVATNPQTPQHTPATKKPEATINPQTQLKSNETRRVLNDGRIAINQETFAGLSNNAEEGIKIIDPNAEKKAKEGAPIGMNDEVLVPGSQEWLMKYNKQAPKTAFTMAALEEQAEDTGLNLGSNHAKIGQPIKKKYNPNNFNIRG